MSFNSGGQEIALDCFLPSANGNKFPTIIGLHGSGGGYAVMSDPAELLAANGFAVYVLHYFDRTGTSQADRDTISIDSRVRAVVEFFGGLPKEMKFFMRRLCPVLILHGEADPTVPVQEAYHLQRVLEKKRIPYEMQIYPGAGHGFEGPVWQDANARTLEFLKKHLAA